MLRFPSPRAVIRLACQLTVALLVAAPVIFGQTFGGVLRALAPAAEHHCACGMNPGECGCEECARLEAERRADAKPKDFPVLKSGCNDDDTSTTGACALPIAAPPALAPVVATPVFDHMLPADVAALASLGRLRPPTPPPRA